jgi:uncharacterized protein with ATP-grasp and redox domains
VLDDLVGALELLALDERVSDSVLSEALEFLAGTFPENRIPSYYITGVHRILKRVSGIEVPFAELREACNRVGAEIAEGVAEDVRSLPRADRFRSLCLWAVAGNHLDFRTVGTGYGFDTAAIRSMLEEKVAEGFAIDETERIGEHLLRAARVVYVPDNVGEIALDRLLVEHLKEGGSHVTVPYRGGPITSDATLPDFRAVGLDTAADEAILAGPDTLGVSFEEISPELRAALAAADAVVTKGQANYYAFHEHRDEVPAPICALLTTKCDVVSGKLGRRGKINVAVVLSEGGAR